MAEMRRMVAPAMVAEGAIRRKWRERLTGRRLATSVALPSWRKSPNHRLGPWCFESTF